MFRSIRSALALALVVAPSLAVAQSAQVAALTSPRPGGGAVVMSSTCCLSRLTEEEAARIARNIELATGLTFEGRMTEARRILRQVIDEQERADAYPAAALQLLANVEFALDRPIVAAGVMVRLAEVAAEAGDPGTELEALLDATVLYSQNGRGNLARQLRPRIQTLLNSPAISAERRQALTGRFNPE